MIRPNIETKPIEVGESEKSQKRPAGVRQEKSSRRSTPHSIHPRISASQPIPTQATTVSSTKPPKHLNLWWPTIVALAAAVAAVFLAGFRYNATARLTFAGDIQQCRSALLDFLWTKQATGEIHAGWTVTAAENENALNTNVLVDDADNAVNVIQTLADGFKAVLASQANNPDSNSEVRNLLDDFANQAKNSLEDARQAHSAALLTLSQPNPFHAREQFREQLATEIESFNMQRAALQNLESRIKRIETSRIPDKGWVTPEARAIAYAARTDLQQDLQQLTMQLTIARRFLEDVWQESSARLDTLISSTSRLGRLSLADSARSVTGLQRQILDDLVNRAGQYQRSLAAFQQTWTEVFTHMRQSPVDPLAARVLAIQSRLHDLLGDFLFKATKLIEDMRDDVRRITEETHGNSRQHQFRSEVTGAFYRFESDHRQFEMIATKVLRRNNFRLDAAIKSAGGLHRRSQATIDAIDARLEEEAIAQSVSERQKERATAIAESTRIKADLEKAIDRILKTQADLLVAIPQADEYQQSQLDSRSARDLLDRLRANYDERRTIADQLKRQLNVADAPGELHDVQCIVSSTPANLVSRLVLAAAAFGLTFAAATIIANNRN